MTTLESSMRTLWRHLGLPKVTAGALALTLMFVAAWTPTALADDKKDIIVPPVPSNLRVPAGHSVYLVGHALGTQDYICLPCPTTTPTCSASGFVWTFYGPRATVFDDDHEQTMTHFLSPNPAEGSAPRATWMSSHDTSAVWAFAPPANVSTDAAFVAPGAIPWLRLQVVGAQTGPTGGDRLTNTTFIQRLDTAGGVAPSSGCGGAADVGKKAFVPYEADYFFYRSDPSSKPHAETAD